MQLHELTGSTGGTKARRIGRGSTRGKTSGRGHKGQKSRAGHSIRPQERDMIKKLPKLRGHGINRSRTVNPNRVRPHVVSLATLEARCDAGARIDPKMLVAQGIVDAPRGKAPQVKILARGTVTKKFTVADCTVSESAKKAILDAGGTVV
jgi:large subunit ribosomal protein L15